MDTEIVVRESIDALGQTHEPSLLGVVGGELRRHPELAQSSQVERRPTR